MACNVNIRADISFTVSDAGELSILTRSGQREQPTSAKSGSPTTHEVIELKHYRQLQEINDFKSW